MLYNFKDTVQCLSKKIQKPLSVFLTEKGYGKTVAKPFQIIRVDLNTEEKANNIIFRKDGVYLIRDGVEYRGYMYLRRYWIERFDNFPTFHITRCSTVSEIEKRQDFVWHNSNKAEISDRSSGTIYKKELELCYNCKRETMSKIDNTQEFFDSLDKELEKKVVKKEPITVDLNGYVKGWQGKNGISNMFRKSKNYTCEKCNISISEEYDQRYIHTDHKDGNKQNNHEGNFRCLCILCHGYKDELHRKNFGKVRNKRAIKTFVDKYRNILIKNNNPYLKQYDEDNSN
jgi:hypothetical protein